MAAIKITVIGLTAVLSLKRTLVIIESLGEGAAEVGLPDVMFLGDLSHCFPNLSCLLLHSHLEVFKGIINTEPAALDCKDVLR